MISAGESSPFSYKLEKENNSRKELEAILHAPDNRAAPRYNREHDYEVECQENQENGIHFFSQKYTYSLSLLK